MAPGGGLGGRRGGDAVRNSPGEHPSKLTGLVRGADGDAAEFGHRGNVLSCGNQKSSFRRHTGTDGWNLRHFLLSNLLCWAGLPSRC